MMLVEFIQFPIRACTVHKSTPLLVDDCRLVGIYLGFSYGIYGIEASNINGDDTLVMLGD